MHGAYLSRMPDSMSTVAGADEAGQTPQAPAGTRQTAEQIKPADGSEPKPGQLAQADAPAPEQTATPAPEQAQADAAPGERKPGFRERGQMRRRARFLRKARELAYRDLGGLVFDLHRFGQRNDPLVLAKLAMLRQLDTELRELEAVLRDRRPVTVLREVGIAACPRCAAIHGSDDRFCPSCGLAFDTHADRPISTAPMAPQAQPVVAPAAAQAPAPNAGAAFATRPMPTAHAPASKPPATPPVQPSPPPKQTAAPVAAKPAPSSSPRAPSPTPSSPASDEEQTQILRPPARDE
jgi:hypothetical protein